MTYLTRRYSFSASHRLHSEQLGPEENARLFGKCNNPFGHGHNYFLEVTIGGELDLLSGMVASTAALDRHVERAVLFRLDHSDLNADLPEFGSLVPTTENLGLQIGRWLQEGWEQRCSGRATGRLKRIRLEETGSNTIEIEFHGQ